MAIFSADVGLLEPGYDLVFSMLFLRAYICFMTSSIPILRGTVVYLLRHNLVHKLLVGIILVAFIWLLRSCFELFGFSVLRCEINCPDYIIICKMNR